MWGFKDRILIFVLTMIAGAVFSCIFGIGDLFFDNIFGAALFAGILALFF